jgi:hypothetical protein
LNCQLSTLTVNAAMILMRNMQQDRKASSRQYSLYWQFSH